MEPRRSAHLLDVAGLIAILVGDAIAFYQVAALALPDAQGPVVGMLVAALSVAATLSMHHVGRAARARRAADDHPGLPWAVVLMLVWFGLGCVSVWFRLAAANASTPAGNADGFGSVVNTAAATQGPLAALLLLLYLVGGMTAYGIGYRMHNPARSAYFRARRAYRRAERDYRRAVRRRDRVNAVPPRWTLPLRRRLGVATPVPADPDAATSPVERPLIYGEPEPAAHDDGQTSRSAAAEHAATDFTIRREYAEARARAQAEQLRQYARHQLAVALAEPASSSGVFAGAEALSHTTRTE